MGLLLRLHDPLVDVDLGGELVEVRRRGDQLLGVGLEVTVESREFLVGSLQEEGREPPLPLLAVRFEGRLERRAVDAEEEQVGDAVLARHLLQERLVPFDVRLEIRQRFLRLAVPGDELILIRLPHVPVGRLPTRHERGDRVDNLAEAVIDGDDLLESGVLVVGDDVVEGG